MLLGFSGFSGNSGNFIQYRVQLEKQPARALRAELGTGTLLLYASARNMTNNNS